MNCPFCDVDFSKMTVGQVGICPHCMRYLHPEWYGHSKLKYGELAKTVQKKNPVDIDSALKRSLHGDIRGKLYKIISTSSDTNKSINVAANDLYLPSNRLKEWYENKKRSYGLDNPLTLLSAIAVGIGTGVVSNHLTSEHHTKEIASHLDKKFEMGKKNPGGYPILNFPSEEELKAVVLTREERRRSRRNNPIASDLYESFHGMQPKVKRKINYTNPSGTLLKIGRIKRLDYVPEGSTTHKGTQFYHISGDTGERKLPSNLILATDPKGENFYLIKDDATKKEPFFSERGIIG